MNFIWSKLGWKGDYSHARLLCFANQWIVQDIPSLNSQSERAKNTSLVWYILTQDIPSLSSQSKRTKTLFTGLVYTNTGYPELE